MYAEVAWVLASSETQVQPQRKLDPVRLPDYPSVFYDYDQTERQEQKFIVCKSTIKLAKNFITVLKILYMKNILSFSNIRCFILEGDFFFLPELVESIFNTVTTNEHAILL